MLGRILLGGALAAMLGACATETRTVVAAQPAAVVAVPVQGKLMIEARTACQAYGLTPYTERYERCVRNEVAYRMSG